MNEARDYCPIRSILKKTVLKKKAARCFDVLQVGFDSDHLYSFFTVHNQTVLVMDR